MKKNVSFMLIFITLVLLICSMLIPRIFGRKPFKKLTDTALSSASVHLVPPDETIEIEELGELTEYLNDVVVYQKDNSFTEYTGQGVIFTLQYQDGSEKQVIAYDPFIIIDGIGYRCHYESCQALSGYANRLLDE